MVFIFGIAQVTTSILVSFTSSYFSAQYRCTSTCISWISCKSSTQMGVRREGALARKLALLVITNLLFSTIPLSFASFFGNFFMSLFFYESFSSLKAATVCSVWVPVLLLCFNSCLNPSLFAFRYHLFKRRFRKTWLTIRQHFIKKQTTPAGQQVNEQRCRNTERS